EGRSVDDKFYRQVRDLVSTEQINKSFIFTGWRKDIRNIIADLDILVQASTTFPEGFGLTCIEAMASEKPVVATNIPGPSEIVLDGETGFLVPPKDVNALAEAILKILKGKDLSRKMGMEGKRRVEEFFDVRRTVKNLEEIYENEFIRN
ncbi:MAG: glycosyltransferase family 4 protein, partial [Candidatus Omnitrophica bacterium]|nr:glycosyltransferase family 4 protein [Candidatus Omnitrophota bacterium]